MWCANLRQVIVSGESDIQASFNDVDWTIIPCQPSFFQRTVQNNYIETGAMFYKTLLSFPLCGNNEMHTCYINKKEHDLSGIDSINLDSNHWSVAYCC